MNSALLPKSLVELFKWAVVLLLAASVAQWRMNLGIAWEDSYHHWLISAYGVVTGEVRDPLAGHGAFLPFVQGLYRFVLDSWGVYNLRALEWTAFGVTMGSAFLLYRWAGWGVALLFLVNPVTVLLGSLPITEPWSLLFLLSGCWCFGSKWRWLGIVALTLAVLADRSAWPLVLGLVGWGLWRKQWAWLLPVAVMGAVTVSNRVLGSLDTTAQWAQIDQVGLDIPARIQALALYSVGSLGIPLGILLLAWWQGKGIRSWTYLGVGYILLITGLVGAGQLTGSPRYYLLVVPLLLLGSQYLLQHRTWLVMGLVGLSVGIDSYYVQQWPRWVVLNRPSVQAGLWLKQQPHQGELYTDSPVVVFYSQWPLDHVHGTAARRRPQAPPGILVRTGDRRYQKLFPGQAEPQGEKIADFSKDWTVNYGAKPVDIFR